MVSMAFWVRRLQVDALTGKRLENAGPRAPAKKKPAGAKKPASPPPPEVATPAPAEKPAPKQRGRPKKKA